MRTAQAISPVDRMECVFPDLAAASAGAAAACVADSTPWAAELRLESKSRFKRLNSARISEAV
jgi:hypothetical protein